MGILQDIIDLAEGNTHEVPEINNKTEADSEITSLSKNFDIEDITSNDNDGSAQNVEIEEVLKNTVIDERNDGIASKDSTKEKDKNLRFDSPSKVKNENFPKKEKTIKDILQEAFQTKEPQTFTTKEGKNYSIMPNSKGGIEIYNDENLQQPEMSFEKMGDEVIDGLIKFFTGKSDITIEKLSQKQQSKNTKEKDQYLGLGKEVFEKLKELVQNTDEKELNSALNQILNPIKKQDVEK